MTVFFCQWKNLQNKIPVSWKLSDRRGTLGGEEWRKEWSFFLNIFQFPFFYFFIAIVVFSNWGPSFILGVYLSTRQRLPVFRLCIFVGSLQIKLFLFPFPSCRPGWEVGQLQSGLKVNICCSDCMKNGSPCTLSGLYCEWGAELQFVALVDTISAFRLQPTLHVHRWGGGAWSCHVTAVQWGISSSVICGNRTSGSLQWRISKSWPRIWQTAERFCTWTASGVMLMIILTEDVLHLKVSPTNPEAAVPPAAVRAPQVEAGVIGRGRL